MGECGAADESVKMGKPARFSSTGFELTFAYADKRFFTWTADVAAAHATFDADFGGGRTAMQVSASFLSPENALSEAMFF
jgi:hypothetical protein